MNLHTCIDSFQDDILLVDVVGDHRVIHWQDPNHKAISYLTLAADPEGYWSMVEHQGMV